jgi:hypothetical protein
MMREFHTRLNRENDEFLEQLMRDLPYLTTKNQALNFCILLVRQRRFV